VNLNGLHCNDCRHLLGTGLGLRRRVQLCLIPMVNDADILVSLKSIPLFRELQSPEDWQALQAGLERLSFQAGQQIFHQGEVGHLLYILLQGQVQISLNDVPLAELKKGTCFGEMALFDAQPRSATATALTDCDCLALSEESLHQLIQHSPQLTLALLQVLGQRLRQLNRLFLSTEELFCLQHKAAPQIASQLKS
jgi:CRP/FNR family transcriptional regulator, cyclic AMP receptor protein